MNKTPIGAWVTLPRHFTYGGRILQIKSWNEKKQAYRLEFVGGKEKGVSIEYFSESEIIPLNDKDIVELSEGSDGL